MTSSTTSSALYSRSLFLALLVGMGVRAAEITLDVPAGQTLDMGPLVEAALAEAGAAAVQAEDIFVKTGDGTLIGTNIWKDVKVHTRVVAGAYVVQRIGDLSGGANIAVRAGASIVIRNKTGRNDAVLIEKKNFFLRGAGNPAVTENGVTGALLFSNLSNAWQIFSECVFYIQDDDTVIALNSFGQHGPFTKAVIDQQTPGHRLTLKGPGMALDANSDLLLNELRFRYGYGFTNTAEIVVNGVALAAHNVSYWARPTKVPLCTVTNTGVFAPDGQSFADCFERIVFEPGTFISSANSAAVRLPKLEGMPYITKKMTATFDKQWCVRAADLIAGRSLRAWNKLTFNSTAYVTVDDSTALDSATVYTLATSRAEITGDLPPFRNAPGKPANWATRLSADGKSLELYYTALPTPDGAINIRDWGILPGADKAAANTAAFAQGLAALAATDAVLFFPQGHYVFDEPLAITGRTGLTLLGDQGTADLSVTDADATCIVSISGSPSVTLTGLAFAQCAGVAVSASGSAGLVITNNLFDTVAGAVTDIDGSYPVAATDCPDVLVRANRVTGGTTYTGLLAAAGTTTLAADSEPTTDTVELWAWPTLESLYAPTTFANALAARGLADYPQGAKLVKRGPGRLYGATADADRARIGPITIAEGTFASTSQNAFGPDGNRVTVADGATVLLEASGNTTIAAKNVVFSLGGNGASTADGGVFCTRSTSWQASLYCTFELRSDITMYNVITSGESCGLFSCATINQNGHALTLRGTGSAKSAWRFRLEALFKNPGPIYVDALTLSASYQSGPGFRGEGEVKPPLLQMKSNARLLVYNQDFCNVFAVYDFLPGAVFEAESNKDLTIAHVKGAPTIRQSVTQLTIPDGFTVRAADAQDGKFLTTRKKLVFGESCTLYLEGELPLRDGENRIAEYTLATADEGITGKPKLSAAVWEAGWQVRVVDGTALKLVQADGTMILVR